MTIHSCSYYCQRPECIKAKRDELRDRLGSMTDREIMQRALEALELLARYENPATKIQVRKPKNGGSIVTMYPHKVATEAAAPLRERLSQPEQEPVAEVKLMMTGGNAGIATRIVEIDDPTRERLHPGQMLYTNPLQRKPWVGLTDEEKAEIWSLHETSMVVTATEAKLKEKNT